MKVSEILFNRAEGLWREAAEKPFINEMAKGSLSHRRYKNYMLQDYLYLKEYIRLLEEISEMAEDTGLKEFLAEIIRQTEDETYRVHLPNMRKLGIDDAEVAACEMSVVLKEYLAYMRKQAHESGVAAGLCALLQCSWVYAYIARKVGEKRAGEIASSPYKSWFEAYNSDEYRKGNNEWIEVLDRNTAESDKENIEMLCGIFTECAKYENRFWDEL